MSQGSRPSAAPASEVRDAARAHAVAAAGLLALLVGVLQLALGVLRLGRIANVPSHPVMVGFTGAAAT